MGLVGLLVGACERSGSGGGELWGFEPPAAPALARRLPLPPGEATTLGVDVRGLLWLGIEHGVRVVDPATGSEVLRVELDSLAQTRIVGSVGEQVYLLAGNELLRLDASGVVRAQRTLGGAAVKLDPLGRYVYHGTAAGTVVGHDPQHLRPRWAWPRLGAAATAIAASPEGDRLYQALAFDSARGAARLLARDLQTGRTLHEHELSGGALALEVAAPGWLYALLEHAGEAELVCVRQTAEGLQTVWRRRFVTARAGAARLRLDAAGRRLLVILEDAEPGLVVLNATDGRSLAEVAEPPIDAAFGAHGALFWLYPEEVQVLQ